MESVLLFFIKIEKFINLTVKENNHEQNVIFIHVLGIPAWGIYHKITIFDLILPRVLAGEKITRKELAKLGRCGLCLNCRDCRYPLCPFGRG